ncbi:Ig-like domain-containing protein [Anaerosalibacter sp. Marseille-P3206]|uniref:Ig-like domain-containing protein n=1 Tax=Anaerosalibacter sp. Marseille-P3206 TaxID=1871005 RepID=UPI0009850BA4|nr:Ig-like domain-containing protein [Anaerosalibacter sp. Marseille-P3206]
MKRTLSLLLVLAMVLSSFGFAFAEEAKEATPAEILNDLGILKGNAEGDLMLDKNLKRQDMVVMLSRLLGVEDEAKAFEGEVSFTDVADSFYVPYIAWAEAKELTNGVGDNKFGFDREVKENEVVAFLLRALGYGEVKWEEVPAKAVELKLVEKDADLTKDATRARLAELTLTALKTKMKDSDKTLAEHLELKLPQPAVLEVKEVRADNLKEIKVVFNKAVDRDNVEDRDIYTTNAGSVKDVQLVDDSIVILTLEGNMTNKKEYKLTIRGLKDAKELNKDYKFKAYDNTVPEVEEVAGLGTKAIKVLMSEPVKSAKSSNFKIDGKSYYGSVSTTGREIVLKPYGSDFSVGDHKLVVKSLEDYAGFKSVEKELEFTIVEDKEAPTVVDVKGTLERVIVTFSEDVDDATVSKDSLYWGGAKSNKADKAVRLSGNRYAFEFSGTKTLPTYETTITVKEIKDYSGNEMKAQDVAFKAEIDQTRPEVLEVEVDVNEIEVKFNKRINKEDATDKRNYVIKDEDGKKVSIKSLDLSADGRTVTIVLYSNLKESKDYTLEITGIRDNTKLANTILPYKETITAGNYKRPVVNAVTVNPEKETIHILFNKKMDVETIANPANYMLVHKDGTRYAVDDLGGNVNVIQDGKAVILELEGCKINKVKIKNLTFGKGKDIVGVILSGLIQDTSENRVQKYGEVIDFTEGIVTAEAEATDKRTIELEFSHPITAAKASDFDYKGFEIDRVVVNGTKDVVIETTKDLDPALTGVTLAIADGNKIETVLDVKVGKQAIKVADGIAPTLKEAEGTINKSATKLTLVLTFDEELSKDYEGLIKRDLTIKRSSDGKSVDMSKADVVSTVSGKTVTIVTEQHVEKGTAYEIEITSPSAIRDIAGNKANKTDGAVVAEEIKEVEDEVKPVDKTELVNAIANAVKVVADKEKYTEKSYKEFEAALKKAEEVKANEKATKEEVEAAAKALEEAIAGLKTVEEPAELTAKLEVVEITAIRKFVVKVKLSDETKNDKVEKFVIDDNDYTVAGIKDGYVVSNGTFDKAPVKVQVVVEGQPILAQQ